MTMRMKASSQTLKSARALLNATKSEIVEKYERRVARATKPLNTLGVVVFDPAFVRDPELATGDHGCKVITAKGSRLAKSDSVVKRFIGKSFIAHCRKLPKPMTKFPVVVLVKTQEGSGVGTVFFLVSRTFQVN